MPASSIFVVPLSGGSPAVDMSVLQPDPLNIPDGTGYSCIGQVPSTKTCLVRIWADDTILDTLATDDNYLFVEDVEEVVELVARSARAATARAAKRKRKTKAQMKTWLRGKGHSVANANKMDDKPNDIDVLLEIHAVHSSEYANAGGKKL